MRLRCASCFVVVILALGWSVPADLHAQGNNNRHDNDKYDIDKHDDGHGNSGNTGMAQQIAALQAQVVALTTALNNEVAARKAADNQVSTAVPQVLLDLANYVTVDQSTINGLSGPHIIFTGVNVHVRNGTGDNLNTPNGLGNLLVGYNEDLGDTSNRGGSHNLVVGSGHHYPSNNGFVAGDSNTLFGFAASVSGGLANTASGYYSSVSGGHINMASDFASSVSGGESNTAGAAYSSVSGGLANAASGFYSSVSGGFAIPASAFASWAAGTLHQP